MQTLCAPHCPHTAAQDKNCSTAREMEDQASYKKRQPGMLQAETSQIQVFSPGETRMPRHKMETGLERWFNWTLKKKKYI